MPGGHFRGGHGGKGIPMTSSNSNDGKIACPTCTMMNAKGATKCVMCNHPFLANIGTPQQQPKIQEVELQPQQPRQQPPRQEVHHEPRYRGHAEPCSGCPSCCSEQIGCCQRTWCCLISFGLILLIALLPASFVYFEYNEMGFVKYTITNDVDTTEAHAMGRYYTGPSHAAVVFPRPYQRVESTLAIFPDNGQEFEVTVVSFFRLDMDRLSDIYEQFGTSSVDTQATTRIESEIKSLAPNYALEDYILKRSEIKDTFYYGQDDNIGLQADLDDIGCILEHDHFWLELIVMPEEVTDRNLDAVVQLELNSQIENEQEAILVQTETDRLEQMIIANITVVNANADATVQYINAVADATILTLDASADATVARLLDEAVAESNSMLAQTDGSGFNALFAGLGITNTSAKKKYIQYFALLDKMTA